MIGDANSGSEGFYCSGRNIARSFVPRFRDNHENTKNPEILKKLEKERILVFTPSISYDDGFILEAAKLKNAVIVFNDKYDDEIFQKDFKEIIKNKQVYLYILIEF